MDKGLIAEASKNLRLKNIILFESNLSRFAEIPDAGDLGQQVKLEVKPEKIETPQIEKSFGVLRVLVDLGVRIVNDGVSSGSEAEPLFQIEATFQLTYDLSDSIGQAALDEFAQYNSVHNVWPFWRQFVFNMANQAGLPCPEVPLNISLQALEAAKESNQQSSLPKELSSINK